MDSVERLFATAILYWLLGLTESHLVVTHNQSGWQSLKNNTIKLPLFTDDKYCPNPVLRFTSNQGKGVLQTEEIFSID